MLRIIKITLVTLSMVTGGIVAAQTSTTKAEKKKSFSGSFSAVSKSNFFESDEYEDNTIQSFALGLGYKLTDSLSVNASGVVNRNDRTEEAAIQNTTISASYSGLKLGSLSYTPTVSGILPTNDVARIKDKYQGAMGLTQRLAYSTSVSSVKLGANFILGMVRNLHEYEQTKEGSFFVRETFTEMLELTVSPSRLDPNRPSRWDDSSCGLQ